MQLLEYQAKELLSSARVPVPPGTVVGSSSDYVPEKYPVVIKSQVPIGGRGKLGGVRVVKNFDEYNEALATLLQLDIRGYVPAILLVEQALQYTHEYYLALQVNRDQRRIECLYSLFGGVDVEASCNDIAVISCEATDWKDIIATKLHIDHMKLATLLDDLYDCLVTNDLLLLEINPLMKTKDGHLMCADAKAVVDDNARFRQTALPWSDERRITPLGGSIGIIANGAGMAMSTVDTVVAMGGSPANFLDIGGGTGEAVFIENIQKIMTLPGVASIIINIFAGITRCDDIAHGIIAAKRQLGDLLSLFVRLEGTNKDEAVTMLKKENIPVLDTLADCIHGAMGVDI